MDSTTTQALDEALELLNAKRAQEAAKTLARLITREPGNERAWHMLSYALAEPEKQVYALRRVLQINPHNRAARSQLKRLEQEPAPAHVPLSEPVEPPPAAVVPPVATAEPSEPAADQLRAQAIEPLPNPVTAKPTPDRPVFSRQTWASGPAVAVAAARPGFVPFPGTTVGSAARYGRWQRFKIRAGLSWRRFKMDWAVFSRSRLALLGIVLIAIFGLLAIAHPILMNTVWPRKVYDPVTGFDMMIFLHPSPPAWVEGGSSAHLLGTDTLGRDVLSMLLAATTPTFVLGLTAALTTAIVGTTMAVTAAYFRGPVDAVITNLADVFLLFPAPVVMVIIGARFRDLGPVPLGLIYGFVTGAGPTALVLRAHALQVVSKPYMEAAHIAGGGAVHIIPKHLLPAMMPLAALQMMIAVTGAVVADGFISFFGLTRTVSNWGTLIYDAFVYKQLGSSGTSTWHMLLPAALCFSLFAMGFYLVSRGLHRVASPTIREEQGRA
ncbi:MAG: ABC transporter permease [Anaerolineae bacterium]|jgi:peptide/nickel transport system permease protein